MGEWEIHSAPDGPDRTGPVTTLVGFQWVLHWNGKFIPHRMVRTERGRTGPDRSLYNTTLCALFICPCVLSFVGVFLPVLSLAVVVVVTRSHGMVRHHL